MMTRTAEDYLDLPYHCVFIHDRSEDGEEGYVAEVEELPGCLSQGRTIAEAADHLREAMPGWIAVMLQAGMPIPERRPEPSYSSKVVVRVAPSLQETVAQEAEQQGLGRHHSALKALVA